MFSIVLGSFLLMFLSFCPFLCFRFLRYPKHPPNVIYQINILQVYCRALFYIFVLFAIYCIFMICYIPLTYLILLLNRNLFFHVFPFVLITNMLFGFLWELECYTCPRNIPSSENAGQNTETDNE
jgi:hypothetical protein